MKLFKRILKIVLCLLLAAVIVVCTVELWYLPRYLSRKKPLDITPTESAGDVKLVSSNVRCWSPTDFGKRSWFYRANLLMRNIDAIKNADVIGFQEVTRLHYAYLKDCLPQYDSVITYRDESLLAEGTPVFYHTGKFKLKDKGSFWLSETPDVMSRGWDAAFNRVCCYVILREKATGKELVVFNVHLDHRGSQARVNSIKLILEKIEAFGGQPCVIMGDLNCGEKSDTYKTATALFDDAKYLAPVSRGPGATYHNWGAAMDHENLDYFLISKTGISPQEYKIESAAFGPDLYPSDHFPISLKISLD